jgi:hypothetical protein
MLVVNDRRLLNDGNLDFWESMERYTEGTERIKSREYRLYDHDILSNAKIRGGERFHHSEFIQKILDLNPTVWVESLINFPGQLGFFTDVNGKKTYLSAIGSGWLPEFSYMVNDRHELNDTEVRGWRTCLVRLLAWGAVSWEQVLDTFGDSHGFNSYRWAEATQVFRSEDCCQKVSKNHANKANTRFLR